MYLIMNLTLEPCSTSYCATYWFCSAFLSASSVVLVPFRLYHYDCCCWPLYRPLRIMCLKILAGFPAFVVRRVK